MSRFKTITVAIGLLLVIMGIPMPTYAQSSKVLTDAQKLTNLHDACNRKIARRLNALNQAIKIVNNLVKISPDQKSQFSNEARNAVASLTALRTKCQADKDLTTLRADYQKIFSYRVYDVLIPHANILIAANRVQIPADKLSDFSNKLKQRIEKSGNKSNLTGMLSNMQEKIAGAKMQRNIATSEMANVSISHYNADANQVVKSLQKARNAIRMGIKNDREAWNITLMVWRQLTNH